MDRAQQIGIEVRKEWRDQFRGWVAVNGIHVDRDSRRLSIRTVQQLHARDFFVPQFRHRHLAMIAAQYLVQPGSFLPADHNGSQKSVALDGLLERGHLLFREVLGVALEREELIEP